METVKAIISKGLPTILVSSGIVALFSAFLTYSIAGQQTQIDLVSSPNTPRLIVGCVLILAGIALYWWEDLSGSWVQRRKVSTSGNGYSVSFGGPAKRAQIAVTFGEIDAVSSNATVVLPANEFFDAECFSDSNSALGAFVSKHVPPNEYAAFLSDVQKSLDQTVKNPSSVEKEANVLAPTYGVGTCIAVDKPLAPPRKLILVAVSTKRAGLGIRSEATFLFSAVSKIHQLMADKRIDSVVLPLLGAGKGGLRAEVSLFILVIAFAEAICRPGGHHIKLVEIVVRRPPDKKPEIHRRTARRILGIGAAMFS